MTSLPEARSLIYSHFLSNFTAVGAERVTFDNEAFDEPADGEWVRLVVRQLTRTLDTLGPPGNRRFRTFASVVVQIFVAEATGTMRADQLAQEIRSLFEVAKLPGISLNASTITEVGPSGRWWQANVDTPFDFYDRR